MRKLVVFDHMSLDGYFVGTHGDMSWAHKHDAEWQAFVADNAGGEAALVFGRITYELMAGYWATPQALADNRAVAEAMNKLPKIVFSRTLARAAWNNTTLISTDVAEATRTLKAETGPDLVILGSGTIVSQLTGARLIDEYQIVVNPIVLGEGRTLFEGIPDRRTLQLIRTRAFGNGNVVLWYAPSGTA